MSQMIWCRPKAVIEKFIPNEYIAACGDSGTVYNATPALNTAATAIIIIMSGQAVGEY